MFATYGVTGDYFEALDGHAALGRLLESGDRDAGAVVSHRLWQTAYGGDAQILGRELTLGAQRIPIVGVAHETFGGTSLHANCDVIVSLDELNRISGTANAVAAPLEVALRLEAGVTPEAYEERLNAAWPDLLQASAPPGRSLDAWREQRGERVRVDSLRRGLTYAIKARPGLRRAAVLVLALSVLIFLGNCLTLALLSVARGVRQQHQVTVMLALGASKARIFRTYLLESACISGVALLGGLLLTGSLAAAAAAWLPGAPEVDWRLQVGTGVVTIAGVIALTAASLIGAIPAVISTRTPVRRLVQSSGRVSMPHVRLRVALLTVQLGLAVLLVHYALVFVGDLRAIARVDVGFNVNDLHIYSLTARPPQRPLSHSYFVALLERVRRIPGVEAAAITGTLPPLAFLGDAAQPVRTDDGRQVQATSVCTFPGLFDTLQLSRLSGQDLEWDRGAAAVVTSSLARMLYPEVDPLTQTIQTARTPPLRIVGVVSDLPYNGQRRGATPVVFVPCLQQANANPWPSTFVVQLVIRSPRTLGDLRKDVDVQVAEAGPQFVYQMEDSTEQLARSTQQERTWLRSRVPLLFSPFCSPASAYTLSPAICAFCEQRKWPFEPVWAPARDRFPR
jgi:hypothetical protein